MVKLYEININQALSLEEVHFKNNSHNIDSICRMRGSNQEQLKYLMIAAELCEKFHSYFHFEQSFLNLQLAEKLEQNGELVEAASYYDQAIFQDHLNKRAHLKLLNCYKLLDEPDKIIELQNYQRRFNIELEDDHHYKRPFATFAEYIKFATNTTFSFETMTETEWACILPYDYYQHKKILPNKVDNFWLSFLCYNITDEIKSLKRSIDLIKNAHDQYHQNSAKIYYNRSLIYTNLSMPELAKNDIIKANNLYQLQNG